MPLKKKFSLSESLEHLKQFPAERKLTLGLMLETLGNKSFGILFICLALPSALPLPAAGYSIPFGIIILTLAGQMLRGHEQPWLPEKAKKMVFSRALFEKMVKALQYFFKYSEHLIRPRLQWINSPLGRALMAFIILIMGMLMCIPIPTTNTFPAIVIFLIAIGLSEGDGLFCVAACFVGIFAVALYIIVIYCACQLVMEYGWEGVDLLKEKLKAFLNPVIDYCKQLL